MGTVWMYSRHGCLFHDITPATASFDTPTLHTAAFKLNSHINLNETPNSFSDLWDTNTCLQDAMTPISDSYYTVILSERIHDNDVINYTHSTSAGRFLRQRM